MKTKFKIALGLIGTAALVLWNTRRKKRKIIFTAPDGNTYKENQIYRTSDNKLYKNGKLFHFPTPPQIPDVSLKVHTENTESIHKNIQLAQKNTSYHQKGNRHR